MKTIMSIDVEDWFQVENLKQVIDKDSWAGNISRVEKNVDLILTILAKQKDKATFFTLGWIAERFPFLIKKIFNEGHEIASHGYNHELINKISAEKFRQDVLTSKNLLEDITGQKVIGYRAPSFSITDSAIDILRDSGFHYDSSLFPTIAHSRYGKLNYTREKSETIFKIRDNFYEIMLSSFNFSGVKLPWSGGFYFRFIPYNIFKRGVDQILKTNGSFVFYIHPWEFDPDQPVVKDIKLQYKFRHYTNLSKTQNKFERLLRDFQFISIKDALSSE